MATVVVSLETLTKQLQNKNAEVTELNKQLVAARSRVAELTKVQAELQVDLARGIAGSEERVPKLGAELLLAQAKVSGLEQLAALAEPNIQELRARWTDLKHLQLREQREAELQALNDEMVNIDAEVHEHQAEIDRLVEKRTALFEKKRALQQQL